MPRSSGRPSRFQYVLDPTGELAAEQADSARRRAIDPMRMERLIACTRHGYHPTSEEQARIDAYLASRPEIPQTVTTLPVPGRVVFSRRLGRRKRTNPPGRTG